jgi:hypothetical protein
MPFKLDATTMAFFNSAFNVMLGDIQSLFFWHDAWLHGQDLSTIVPDLVTTVPMRKRSSCMVASALDHNAWIADISGTLTVQVLLQFL